MSEPQPPAINDDQARGLGLVQGERVLRRSEQDRSQIVGVAHSRHQQGAPGGDGKHPDTRTERPLNRNAGAKRIIQRLGTQALPLAQDSGDLDQRQRVPARRRNELRDDSWRKR